jgi:lipopolysaccharide transport system permease protein
MGMRSAEAVAVGRAAHTAVRPVRRIEPTRGFRRLDVKELWSYRELLYFLVWRDVKIRYKQTFLGPLWAVLRPFLMMVAFTLVFNKIARIQPGSGAPYQLFSFAGVAIWTYFASAFSGGSSSLLGNASLVGKVYFPRLYVALAAITAPVVDLAFALLAGIALFAAYGYAPGWQLVLAPLFVALMYVFALGMSLWLAPLTVRYRDIPFALGFLTQMWMFVTPVAYPLSKLLDILPSSFRWVAEVNPLTGAVVGFRWALLGGDPPTVTALLSSLALSALLLVTGISWFRRAERTLADIF